MRSPAISPQSRRLLAVGAAAAILAAVFLPAATAAPPPNDAFSAALSINGDAGVVAGTNVDATAEPGEPAHGESSGRSVWFRWVAPAAGPVLFETCGGASFDTVLAVYTGSAVSALAEIQFDDDACDGASRVVFAAAAGTTYLVAVAGFEGASGTFTLRWRRLVPPANDAFAAPAPLAGTSGVVQATTTGATVEPGEPRHAGRTGASIWFTWSPTIDATANVETCGSSFDTVLAVYTGDALSALASVATNDDACRGASRVQFVARAGTVYRIAVAGAGASSYGDVSLRWIVARPPANARSASARRLRGARGSVPGTNVGAPDDPKRDGDDAAVWYRWRAPASAPVTFETCGDVALDTSISVYRTGTGRRTALLERNDDACDSTASRVAFFATRNVEYLIAVGGYAGAWGAFTLTWRPSRGSDGSCRVPDVRGLTLARARAELEARDCRLGRVVRTRSSIVPRGRVITQFPNTDQRLPLFARVNVEVSA